MLDEIMIGQWYWISAGPTDKSPATAVDDDLRDAQAQVEHREYFGTAGAGRVRPSRWVPWDAAAGRSWPTAIAAMRWAMVAREVGPNDPVATARLAAIADDHVRWAWRSSVSIFRNLRLVRVPRAGQPASRMRKSPHA